MSRSVAGRTTIMAYHLPSTGDRLAGTTEYNIVIITVSFPGNHVLLYRVVSHRRSSLSLPSSTRKHAVRS
jgi:hypothetical protein